MKTKKCKGALQGLKVLDITHVLAGPFCAYQLALLGADVIKIESPNQPDCARGRGPDMEKNLAELGLTYQMQAANKRALALDIKTEQGRDILKTLVKTTDILIENYTTGSLDKLGLGYVELCRINPNLIYCSITGYGDTGPQARTPAYDNVIQATSGIIAQSAGFKPGVSFVDYSTGYSAAFSILAALQQLRTIGRGCHISVSMLEVAMSLMAPEVAEKQYQAHNNTHVQKPLELGIKSYSSKDGLIMLGVFAPHQYVTLYAVLSYIGFDLKALKYIKAWKDVWNLTEKTKVKLENIIITKNTAEWIEILHGADLAAEAVQTLEMSINAKQLMSRNYFAVSPSDKKTKLPLAPYKMSEGGPELTISPPKVGEHSEKILSEIGYSDQAIKDLIHDEVIK